jgi:hypothetical protein
MVRLRVPWSLPGGQLGFLNPNAELQCPQRLFVFKYRDRRGQNPGEMRNK